MLDGTDNTALERPKVALDERAADAVRAHLLAFITATETQRPSCLAACLLGEPGGGKSTLAEAVARELGCDPVVMAAAKASDSHENIAWEKFQASVRDAAARGRTLGLPGVLVVNDIDRSNWSTAEEGTINRSIMIGNLQGWVDDMHGGRAPAVCLIMTSNSLEAIPEALQRPGRMRVVVVRSSWRVRRRQVRSLLADNRWAAEILMLRRPRMRIAGLAAAIGHAREHRVERLYKKYNGDLARVRQDAPAVMARPVGTFEVLRAASGLVKQR